MPTESSMDIFPNVVEKCKKLVYILVGLNIVSKSSSDKGLRRLLEDIYLDFPNLSTLNPNLPKELDFL